MIALSANVRETATLALLPWIVHDGAGGARDVEAPDG
jgi:hypothetical protein